MNSVLPGESQVKAPSAYSAHTEKRLEVDGGLPLDLHLDSLVVRELSVHPELSVGLGHVKTNAHTPQRV